jgi:ABC-type taurine transport system ATPase subunit
MPSPFFHPPIVPIHHPLRETLQAHLRTTMPVLKDVSLFLPTYETVFIIGGSRSSKSTIVHLDVRGPFRLYTAQRRPVVLGRDVNVPAPHRTCRRLFDMSVHDNVAMGLAGLGSGKSPADARREVVEACMAALVHEIHQTSTRLVQRKAFKNDSIRNGDVSSVYNEQKRYTKMPHHTLSPRSQEVKK